MKFISRKLKQRGYNPQLVINAYLFILPCLVLVMIFVLLPILITLGLGFFRYDAIRPPTFVKWSQYSKIIHDPIAWKSLYITIYYLIGTLPPTIILAFGLALLLTERWFKKLRSLFLPFYFFPFVIAYVAVGYIWAWILDPLAGVLNYLLILLGLNPLYWLRDPAMAMPSIWLIANWKHLGFFLLLYIAGIASLPEEYYDAAKIDGVSTKWQEIRYITWPLLRPTTFFLLIMGSIGALSVFDIVYVTTQGGPANATQVIVLYIWKKAFYLLKFGEGSALTTFLFFMSLGVIWMQWKYYTSITKET